jgi:hypothetical protein
MSAPLSLPSSGVIGPKVNRLLLPINLYRCATECIAAANDLTKPFDAEVVLLHVFEESPHADERECARHCLTRLGQEHLRSTLEWAGQICVGNVASLIMAQAKATRSELIFLPVCLAPWWRKYLGTGGYGRTTRFLIGQETYPVFVMEVRKAFDCMNHWKQRS